MLLIKKPILIYICLFIILIDGFPEQGKWDFTLTKEQSAATVQKSMYGGTNIFVQITCQADPDTEPEIEISWKLYKTTCYYDDKIYPPNTTVTVYAVSHKDKCSHGGHIILNEIEPKQIDTPEEISKRDTKMNDVSPVDTTLKTKPVEVLQPVPVCTVPHDGIYLFTLNIKIKDDNTDYKADVLIEMHHNRAFLSAVDWPLLPFYGAMCLVYVVLGIIWLVVSFLQWRDLLRIQFWIGGVILLGMMEKAMFYAEYQSINTNGVSVKSAVLFAEWVSCAKRTLARMLVIIVSLGFGIVKPRLGPMLHRVVGTGALYFVLACVESYLRVMHTKHDPSNQIFLASIPLAVLDSAICWWIFTSLVQTTRTLRLRRNMVKLSLYRHFTNTLIFAVIASVIFMLYSIKLHRLVECLTDWKELWADEAFWHVLFSLLLLVIMILWRPTNNNQRYAFTPLLDNPEDEDDEEEDQFVSDAYGVKMRGPRSNSPKPTRSPTTTEEDDLRWVEENIPAAIADAALPVLDSDEEIINTKFEVSKMQ